MLVSISKPRKKSSEFENVLGPAFCILVVGLICKEQIQSDGIFKSKENAFYSEGYYV